MCEPLLGEIRMFAGSFAPQGWAFCDGQLLPVGQNDALFSLLGTTYGGDGRTTFGLPDLRGRVPLHPGTGPGLSSHRPGEKGGQETVQLTADEMPRHDHAVLASSGTGQTRSPAGAVCAVSPTRDQQYGQPSSDTKATMHHGTIQAAGRGNPQDNMPPYLGVNSIIALVGVYPSRH